MNEEVYEVEFEVTCKVSMKVRSNSQKAAENIAWDKYENDQNMTGGKFLDNAEISKAIISAVY